MYIASTLDTTNGLNYSIKDLFHIYVICFQRLVVMWSNSLYSSVIFSNLRILNMRSYLSHFQIKAMLSGLVCIGGVGRFLEHLSNQWYKKKFQDKRLASEKHIRFTVVLCTEKQR
jgi:hypothetical protein